MAGTDPVAGKTALTDRIVGAWRLVSYSATHGDVTRYPMGPDAKGLLIYADGIVSVNLMVPGRPRPGRGTIRDLDDVGAGPLAKGYMAYAGPYWVDEDAGIIHHNFELCLDPALIGAPAPRHARLIDGQLELSAPPILVKGVERTARLLWRRCDAGGPDAEAEAALSTR